MLSHPNLLKVYDFNRDGEIVYKVMELIKGEHLKQRIKKQKEQNIKLDAQKIDEIFNISKDIAKALSFVHSKHIVHSDLKPSNIFIDHTDTIKVFDFGIARTIKHNKNLDNQSSADESIFDPSTFAAFTPKYSSYEMLTGQKPCPSDDIYALGCIIYELLTNRHPFDGKNAIDARNLGLKVEDVEGLDPQRQAVLNKCLAFSFSERFMSMDDFLGALDKDQKGTQGKIVSPLSKMVFRSNKLFMIVAIIFGIVDLALLAYLIPAIFLPKSSSGNLASVVDKIPSLKVPQCNDLFANQKALKQGASCNIKVGEKADANPSFLNMTVIIPNENNGSAFAIQNKTLTNDQVHYICQKSHICPVVDVNSKPYQVKSLQNLNSIIYSINSSTTEVLKLPTKSQFNAALGINNSVKLCSLKGIDSYSGNNNVNFDFQQGGELIRDLSGKFENYGNIKKSPTSKNCYLVTKNFESGNGNSSQLRFVYLS